MTPEEFAVRMKEIMNEFDGDEELCHVYMDGCMCNLLTELGYGEGVDIFVSADKWYA